MTSATVDTRAASPRAASGFRPDIQGLRAVAVGAVLLFHANFPFLRGGFVGVDVFFVISGFLITGILMREALATGRIRLGDFYAKRARRILPAATIVLIVTAALTVWFLPQIRWESIGIEIGGAAIYIVNWFFAANTDYLNAEVAASPIQHFWTLAVEEQFYIVWPLILIALLALMRYRVKAGAAKRLGARQTAEQAEARVLRYARIGVLLILVPSFVWSVYYTAVSPAPAYFVTTTRLWELAIGAVLAVFATQLERIPDWLGYALGWAGLAAILVACVFYSGATAFPGSAALLPTLGAAAMIVGGMNGRATRGAGVLLCLRPMRWVGDISYSLYLWHWPLIVVGTYLLGGELRFRWGLAIVLVSVLFSWLSYRFVENPFRNWSKLKASIRSSLLAGGNLVLVSALVGTALFITPRALEPSHDQVAEDTPLGAEALEVDPAAGDAVDEVPDGFIPSALDAREDNPVVYDIDCHVESDESRTEGCSFGDEESDVDVVLVGDSHAANWAEPMVALAEEHDWHLRVFTKSACSFADVEMVGPGSAEYPGCTDWNNAVLDELLESSPDLVVTTNSAIRTIWDDGPLSQEESVAPFAEGLNRTWETLNDAGVPVVVIRDTPRMDIDVPECVSANQNRLTECAVPRSEAIDDQPNPEQDEQLPDTEVIDMNEWICPDDRCSSVIGNVLVWRDGHHLTGTFARTLAKPLEDELRANELSPEALFPPNDE